MPATEIHNVIDRLRESEDDGSITLLKSPAEAQLMVSPTARFFSSDLKDLSLVDPATLMDRQMDVLLAHIRPEVRVSSVATFYDRTGGLGYPRAMYTSGGEHLTIVLFPDYQLAENMLEWQTRFRDGKPVDKTLESLNYGLRKDQLVDLALDPVGFNYTLRRRIEHFRSRSVSYVGYSPAWVGTPRTKIPGVTGLI